jgi:hypothetical protein
MGTTKRPFRGSPVRLVLSFARASVVLEGAVLGLLSDGWEEDSRQLAHHMAGALRQAARHAGWWDRESALRAIESLLALSASELLPIRMPIGDKLRELLAYLMNVPSARSA